uniref:Ribosomal protein L6 n=1 Tax=Ahnfeltia plicata TaxID=28023 RepID=A0A1C9CBC1_9FLOR|nr:ribosomal protein L6 [Ahnfeltia plicata]AOM65676.1 ribosomal protein L6 [Ahnfeltia plicata]UAT97203.1 ribosomal protein L6 [Ahnfeltia plicata]UAT97408.1 ribosomal protein L6 [Ahnfeltia plicata]
MSRIGKQVILIPDKISTKIENNRVVIKGPKGELSYILSPLINIRQENNILKLARVDNSKNSLALYGLSRTLINNMIMGVSEGFSKKLEIQGVGYRSQMDGKNLILNVGYSHAVQIDPPKGIDITVDNNTNITISGINKEIVGQIAAKIREVRPPEPYKGKGIRYQGEIVRKKVGKAGK